MYGCEIDTTNFAILNFSAIPPNFDTFSYHVIGGLEGRVTACSSLDRWA